ncbi:MAG: hypothetical protein OK452_05200 [Thaumarchaeota archaeon]|nr:hypothetical protein [Nitrososphaerota archaeon]
MKNQVPAANSRRGFAVDTLATLLITAGLGFLLFFLASEAFYVECAQKASSCSDTFYWVFDLLVIGFSVAAIALAGGGVALSGAGRRAAIRNISIPSIDGSVLAVLYGMIPTSIFGIGGLTIYYGFPFTDFVQSAGNTFYASFLVLNYAFWFGLGYFVRSVLRLRKSKRSLSDGVRRIWPSSFGGVLDTSSK